MKGKGASNVADKKAKMGGQQKKAVDNLDKKKSKMNRGNK